MKENNEGFFCPNYNKSVSCDSIYRIKAQINDKTFLKERHSEEELAAVSAGLQAGILTEEEVATFCEYRTFVDSIGSDNFSIRVIDNHNADDKAFLKRLITKCFRLFAFKFNLDDAGFDHIFNSIESSDNPLLVYKMGYDIAEDICETETRLMSQSGVFFYDHSDEEDNIYFMSPALRRMLVNAVTKDIPGEYIPYQVRFNEITFRELTRVLLNEHTRIISYVLKGYPEDASIIKIKSDDVKFDEITNELLDEKLACHDINYAFFLIPDSSANEEQFALVKKVKGFDFEILGSLNLFEVESFLEVDDLRNFIIHHFPREQLIFNLSHRPQSVHNVKLNLKNEPFLFVHDVYHYMMENLYRKNNGLDVTNLVVQVLENCQIKFKWSALKWLIIDEAVDFYEGKPISPTDYLVLLFDKKLQLEKLETKSDPISQEILLFNKFLLITLLVEMQMEPEKFLKAGIDIDAFSKEMIDRYDFLTEKTIYEQLPEIEAVNLRLQTVLKLVTGDLNASLGQVERIRDRILSTDMFVRSNESPQFFQPGPKDSESVVNKTLVLQEIMERNETAPVLS